MSETPRGPRGDPPLPGTAMERIRKILRRTNPRQIALYALVAVLLVSARPARVTLALGLALILPGEVLRLWATGHLRKNEVLTTGGPFAYVRNPLYLGTLLIGTGFVVAASDPAGPSRYVLWIGLPLFLVFFFVFYFPHKDRVEQDRLIQRFGPQAESYTRTVPALVPSLRRFPESARDGWSARQVVRNSEHLTAIGVLVGIGWIVSRLPG